MVILLEYRKCRSASCWKFYLSEEGRLTTVLGAKSHTKNCIFPFITTDNQSARNIQVASRLQFRSRELASPNPEEILTVFLWRHLDLLPDEVILLISPLQSITKKMTQALNTLLLLEAAWLPSGWGSKTNIR